jgi:hypothetical protein
VQREEIWEKKTVFCGDEFLSFYKNIYFMFSFLGQRDRGDDNPNRGGWKNEGEVLTCNLTG